MHGLIRWGRTWAVLLLMVGVCQGVTARQVHGEATAEAPSVEEQLVQRFKDLAAEVERLKAAGEQAAADALAGELKVATALWEGEFKPPASDEPELHAVGVVNGGTAPAGVLKGNDRFTHGYAEISITHTAAPILLCASATERMHLQFKLAPGVRLTAVILGGRYTPAVGGLPEGTLVINRALESPNAMGAFPMSFGDGGFQQIAHALREYSGKDLLTVVVRPRDASGGVLVGPENKTWRAQYLLSGTENAARRAAAAARAEQIKRFANVRFRGLFYQSERDGLGDGTATEAEFTAAGPVIETMKPIDKVIRHLVHEPNSGLDFAIDHWTQLVVVDPKGQENVKVPRDDKLPNDLRLNTLGFDTKRNRFVLNQRDAPQGIYEYDLKNAAWTVLQEKGPNLAALTYVPETDEFWGVTVSDRFPGSEGPGKGAGFCRLSAKGEVVEQFKPSHDLTNTFGDYGGTTLVVQDGMLIVVTPPNVSYLHRENPDGRTPTSTVYVVDPKTKEVIYSGAAVPHDGNAVPKKVDPIGAPSGDGLLHRLFDRLSLADQTVKKYHEQGEVKKANELAARVQGLRDRLAGKGKPDPKAKPQLHLVGGYGAQGTVVEVTKQSAPIILVLCSYERSQWTIRAAEGAKVERIILGGYHRQSVKESPAGVPVEKYSYDDRTDGFYTNGPTSDGHTHALKRIEELTGMAPATLQQVAQPNGTPVIIGDANGAWLVQMVVAELDALLLAAMNERQAERQRALEGLTFLAPYRIDVAGRARHESGVLQFGKFTIRGPMPQTLVDAPKGIEQIAVDPTSGEWFGRHRAGLFKIDPETGETTEIEWDGNMPELSHPSAIALDTRRKRLLLSSFGGGGYLYAYDLKQSKWSTICRPGLDTRSMIYVPGEDAIFAINHVHGGAEYRALRKYSPRGALLESVPLPNSLHSEGHPTESQVDLAYADGRIAILGPLVPDPLDATSLIPRIHVVDLATKRLVYSGLARPHPGVLALTPKRLDELWQVLADRDPQKAEKGVWELAAGHAKSVEYIASHLPPHPKVDEAEVKKLIGQLDSDAFETRRGAQEKLASFGGLIAPLLEAERENGSAEVRGTVRRLLLAIEQNTPESPALAREVRSMKVLEIIGTPEAIKLLGQLAEGIESAERTKAARQSLERLAELSGAGDNR